MPISSRNLLKSWFERGDKPLATQFASWMDSYWHKEEDQIPQANIEGLVDLLNTLAETDSVVLLIDELRTELRDGVSAPGDTLKKLYDLIVALQSSKLDASAYNQHFKGKFLTEAAMNAAYIPAQLQPGDYAQVNEAGSTDVRTFHWDDEDEVWVEGGSGGSGASDTDALPEGAVNLYFTAARVLATVITGFVAGAGMVANTDTVLQAINKIVGNIALKQDALGYTAANDADVVKLTGNQTIAGVKTFSSFPVTPSSDPTTDYQAANKKYVDDRITINRSVGSIMFEYFNA